MSTELFNELEVINSIYGPDTLKQSNDTPSLYTLSLPHHAATLRLSFPPAYPECPPQILGTETAGASARKGQGKHVVTFAQETLAKVYVPGLVCIFDLLQELEPSLAAHEEETYPPAGPLPPTTTAPSQPCAPEAGIPTWTLSDPVTEKKSVFLARACALASPAEVQPFLAHLLATDKRAAKATHNIVAYRLRCHRPGTAAGPDHVVFQDCDDDGESAAGGRLLRLLQVMGVWGVLVVVSRWYGGVRLGPDRFRIIGAVAREAVVRGGWGEK